MTRLAVLLLLSLVLFACGPAEREARPTLEAPASADERISHYTCPMHPAVHEAHPGKCPICGMTLVPVLLRGMTSGEVQVDPARLQRLGVRFASVERGPLVRSLRASGTVAWDEAKLVDVSLRVGGTVRELFADALGARVIAGEPLFTVYSPELQTAQLEYLDALRARKTARTGSVPERADGLVRAARERLRLWDLADADVAALVARGAPLDAVPVRARAGGYLVEKNVVAGSAIEAGTRLLRIAPLDRVWIEAQVFESDAAEVSVGQRATVHAPALADEGIAARVAYIQPTLDPATRTLRARLELANPELALRPGMWVEVELENDLAPRLHVPTSAVLQAGARRVVFVDRGEGRLEPRTVETGIESDDAIEIKSGLSEGERVVASGTFLIGAESRIAAALEGW